jgi:hypothetical protein
MPATGPRYPIHATLVPSKVIVADAPALADTEAVPVPAKADVPLQFFAVCPWVHGPLNATAAALSSRRVRTSNASTTTRLSVAAARLSPVASMTRVCAAAARFRALNRTV